MLAIHPNISILLLRILLTFSFDFSVAGAWATVDDAACCPATFLLRSSSALGSTPVVCAFDAMVARRECPDPGFRCKCVGCRSSGEIQVRNTRRSSLGGG